MTGSEKLEPPQGAPVSDPGAHDLADISDSEDQFTDAQSAPASPNPDTIIPKTRVEKLDDEPSYGEVPGTPAHALREQDAKPDEIAIASVKPSSDNKSPSSDTIIPTTLVEESAGDLPRRHSAEYEARRKSDASPDLVVSSEGNIKAIQVANTTDGRPSTEPHEVVSGPASQHVTKPYSSKKPLASTDDDVDKKDDGDNTVKNEKEDEEDEGDEEVEDDGFGDDFDDFEEGAEDDDFDDFEDGFQGVEVAENPAASTMPAQPSMLPFPLPDFDGLDHESVISTIDPYLPSLFPPEELNISPLPPLPKDSSIFLTPRSASLWSQLVAPPPLAPPDWIRSRIRRLFLVSLGVPVDLDEILPASKQKKLVLPSLSVPGNSPRTSSDSRSVSRLRQGEGNASSTSVDTQGRVKKKGHLQQPELDLVAARHLCMTTDEALNGMTNEELELHVDKLEAMEGAANEALGYWRKRTDEKIGDREAFEGVIENLVKHARKVRK